MWGTGREAQLAPSRLCLGPASTCPIPGSDELPQARLQCAVSAFHSLSARLFRGPSPDSAPAAHICPHTPHCWLTGEGAQRWGSGQKGPICTYLSSRGI